MPYVQYRQMIPPGSSARTHIFTVDVEEYFQVSAFEHVVPRQDWPSYPSRVAESIARLLLLLAQGEARATFFVLGWLAKRQPDMVRRIAAAGHEIASHGWSHERVTAQTAGQFRSDVRTTKEVLEEITGLPVLGYRAPSFSIVPEYEWALDVLVEEGYLYDSSLFPIRRANYGYPDAPPVPHVIERSGGYLVEFPPATTVWRGLRIPAAGGAYFRHFPYAITRHVFREHAAAGVPAVFYIHPWELDPDQPRLPVSMVTRVRHYRGLSKTASRIERLLSEFRFATMREALASAFTGEYSALPTPPPGLFDGLNEMPGLARPQPLEAQ